MNDLVQRLRESAQHNDCEGCGDAADEIEPLRRLHNEEARHNLSLRAELMTLRSRLVEAESLRDYWEAQAKRTSVENVRAARLSRSVTAPE